MKKYILLFAMFFALIVNPLSAQTTKIFDTNEGKLVSFVIPITLAKSATNFSTAFSLDEYLPYDSTSYIPVTWQANDTCVVTVALQVKNSAVPYGATEGDWETVATLSGATAQANAGNDTLYVKNIIQRGAVLSGVLDLVSLAGKIGNVARLSVTFAAPTTVGNSGYFRSWVYLKKR